LCNGFAYANGYGNSDANAYRNGDTKVYANSATAPNSSGASAVTSEAILSFLRELAKRFASSRKAMSSLS
jgi:hypothetical protein